MNSDDDFVESQAPYTKPMETTFKAVKKALLKSKKVRSIKKKAKPPVKSFPMDKSSFGFKKISFIET